MRIVTISRIAALALMFFSVLLAAILYWGIGKLNHSFDSAVGYSELHRKLSVDVRNKIHTYLETGDATFHVSALSDLDEFNQQVLPNLPDSLIEQLEPVANGLYLGLSNDFLGAGKLAGDEQGLLYQNERETAAELNRLESYSIKVLDQLPQVGVAYLQSTMRLTALLSDIKTLRENFWRTGNDSYVRQLEETRERYDQELKKLASLPRIGLFPEQQKDDIPNLMGWAKKLRAADIEEQGDEILLHLISLYDRYPLEMERSIEGQRSRAESSMQVNQLINDFEKAIAKGQQYVTQSKDAVESLVKNLFFASAAGLLIMAALLYLFQKRFVVNNLAKLESALTVLVQEGCESVYRATQRA